MPIGLIQEAFAARALQFGAIGIGEEHTDGDGRDLAIRLIQGGSVRKLFVELAPNVYQAGIDNAVQQRNAGHAAVRGLLGFGSHHRSPIALEEVVAQAILNGVEVHCVDDRIAMNPNRANSPAGMRKRNATVVDNVRDTAGIAAKTGSARDGGCAGCLLLFGGAHFEGASSITNMFPDLQWVKAG